MKNKIYFFCMLPVIAACLVFHSCSGDKTPVIGLLMDQFNVERWAKDTTAFIKAVKDLNGKVICKVANGDADRQFKQARQLVDEGVDVIVIVPVDTYKAADIVAMAKKARVPVISYDRLIRNAFLDYYISFDNAKVGEIQADYIQQRLGKGNIAIIGGPVSDQNSAFLKFGQLGILQPYIERGEIKIVFDKVVDSWSFDEGYKLAKDCLNENQVDAIIAGNDLLASAAIRALEEKGMAGKVLVAGQDADTQACENIIKGIQTMTVYKSIEDLASNAARMAMDLATGKPVTSATFTVNNGLRMVPSMLLNPTLVNKGNIGLDIQAKPAN